MTKKQERFQRDNAAGFSEPLEEQETSKYDQAIHDLEEWERFLEYVTWDDMAA